MTNQSRPISPHLTVYRWPITMTLSILHRATGAALSLGFVAMALWLISAASGSAAYADFTDLLDNLFGKVLLIGWSFSFFFHLANGVRHLFWDVGLGLEKSQANTSAWFVLVLTFGLTAAYWLI